MKVLVTGASGFVGQACVRTLRARGVEVLTPSSRELDLLDDASVRDALRRERPTHLLHAAWSPVHGDVMRSPANFIWLQASLSLIARFAEAGGRRAAVLGSCAEYDWTYGICRTGITPLRPSTAYGAAKHALHVAGGALANSHGLSFVWPRPFFIYGPGEHRSRLARHVLESVLEKRPVDLTPGRQIRDYLAIDDVAEGVVAALASDLEGEIDIASGEPLAVRDLALQIARQLGGENLLRFGARAAPAEPPVVLSDIRVARSALEWRPRISLEEGVASFIAWAREARPASAFGIIP